MLTGVVVDTAVDEQPSTTRTSVATPDGTRMDHQASDHRARSETIGCGQFAVHGATVTRTVGLVSPRTPSLDGVENTVRKSAVPNSRSVEAYVPVGLVDGGRVARLAQVEDPTARRCSRIVRPPIGLALNRP